MTCVFWVHLYPVKIQSDFGPWSLSPSCLSSTKSCIFLTVGLLCSQGLCKALQELRAEMVATAERNVIANAAQKEESLNVQILVDKQTKELKAEIGRAHV